jgi:hypothetical protein
MGMFILKSRPLRTMITKVIPTIFPVSSPSRRTESVIPAGSIGTRNKRESTTKIVTGRNVPRIKDLLKYPEIEERILVTHSP